jgi:hypothetical protein
VRGAGGCWLLAVKWQIAKRFWCDPHQLSYATCQWTTNSTNLLERSQLACGFKIEAIARPLRNYLHSPYVSYTKASSVEIRPIS